MSILRAAVRMCTVAALRNHTWAEDRVLDSDSTPLIDALIGGPAKPYIVVYTDDDNHLDINGREFYVGRRELWLILELGIASAIVVEGENQATLDIPQTDEAMEAAIDIIESQAMAALLGDVTSEFGELFKRMIMTVRRVPSMRGGSAEKGTRFASRKLSLVCQPIADLPPGVVAEYDHVIRDFITALQVHTELEMVQAANLLNASLEGTATADWRQAQSWLGLTRQGARALGIAPQVAEDEEAATFTQGTPVWDETLIVPYPQERRREDYDPPAITAEPLETGEPDLGTPPLTSP